MFRGADAMERCGWVGDDPLYRAYHDDEWGVPQRDARALWEQLVLETFQSGLSWITIFRKREAFRAAFADFNPAVIARWGDAEVARLLADRGIVRHRGKIMATIGNAQAFLEMQAGQGFERFVWDHVNDTPLQPRRTGPAHVPARTDLSARLSRGLNAAGFRFCGPTTAYAFMQAAGLVNDHLTCCGCHDRVAALG